VQQLLQSHNQIGWSAFAGRTHKGYLERMAAWSQENYSTANLCLQSNLSNLTTTVAAWLLLLVLARDPRCAASFWATSADPETFCVTTPRSADSTAPQAAADRPKWSAL